MILNSHQIKEILKEKSRKEGIEQRKQIAQLYKLDNDAFGIESSLEYRDFSYVDVMTSKTIYQVNMIKRQNSSAKSA